MMPSWENLDDFFDLDSDGGFAIPAIVVSEKGWTRSIRAIFDAPYYNAQIGEYEADSSEPRLSAKASDLSGVLRGDTVSVAGQTYDVLASPEFDGTGTAILRLVKQDAAF